MKENDLIAEYVKEEYPEILDFNYSLWKIGRLAGEWCKKVADALAGIDWSKAAQFTETGGDNEGKV